MSHRRGGGAARTPPGKTPGESGRCRRHDVHSETGKSTLTGALSMDLVSFITKQYKKQFLE